MRPRPVPGDRGAEIERHFQPLARIEPGAAHLGESQFGPR
jgi:hypothetical protein